MKQNDGGRKKPRWTRAQKMEARRAAARGAVSDGRARRRGRDESGPRGSGGGRSGNQRDGRWSPGGRREGRFPSRGNGSRQDPAQAERVYDRRDGGEQRGRGDQRDGARRDGAPRDGARRGGDRPWRDGPSHPSRGGAQRRTSSEQDRRDPRSRPGEARRAPRAQQRPGSSPARVSPSVEATPESLPDKGFGDLGVPAPLVERLARDGIVTPFPIQQATIPDALDGRDVLGRGRTGSGKTLAFGLPLLARLAAGGRARAHQPRAIVLEPTRELAMQVSDALQPLVHVLGLHHKLVAGGMPYPPQLSALERGVDLLIATPGRLIDLIERGAADLSRVEISVLDEADHMAQMGFLEEISRILDLTPAGGQRLLFSATLDRGVDKVVERYLSDPVEHATDGGTASVATMDHRPLLVQPHDKKAVTAQIAARAGRTVVFVRTKLGADRVAQELRDHGVVAAALHGGLAQGQRNRVLSAFKDGRVPVLVATDVAARGIHVDEVTLVLQVDPPADHKDYLHRAGRTARAGETGAVVTLVLPHQKRTVRRLLDEAGVQVPLAQARPGDEVILAAGGRQPSGVQVTEQDLRRLVSPPGSRGGRGPRRGRPGGGGSRGPRPARGGNRYREPGRRRHD